MARVYNRYKSGRPMKWQFDLGASERIIYSHYEFWKASPGWKAEVVYYRDRLHGTRVTRHLYALTRRGIRRKLARLIQDWRRADHRYEKTRERSR